MWFFIFMVGSLRESLERETHTHIVWNSSYIFGVVHLLVSYLWAFAITIYNNNYLNDPVVVFH